MSGGANPLTDLRLVPFTRALLPRVQPWFHHPEVDRWLGGPDWPAHGLDQPPPGPDEWFRGMRVLRVHTWLAVTGDGTPVAQIGGDVFDRWCEGDRTEPGPAMGFAYVVDPSRWRQGIGRATLRLMFDAPELADVIVFAAGIEPENQASTRCARSAGMHPATETPDYEGIVYHLFRRPV